MANVTLLGKLQAKPGHCFEYVGPLGECKDCKVKQVCFNLKEGHRYRVLNIRSTQHECPVHEEGVVAVEFEPLALEAVLDRDDAIAQAVVELVESRCGQKGCPNFDLCNLSLKLGPGRSFRVARVVSPVTCPAGRTAFLVQLEEA